MADIRINRETTGSAGRSTLATVVGKEVPGGAGREHLRVGLSLSLVTLAQLATSFGIQWYTVARLGAGAETDALYAGATLPQIIMVVLIEPLGFVLTPMWSVMPEAERRTAGWWVFWLLTFLSILIALLLLLVAPVIMPVLAPGFSASTAQLTLALARIQSAAAVGAICTMMLSSLCHAAHKFIWPAVATLIWSLLGWFILVAGLEYGGVTLAAWVQVLCHIGPVLFLAPAIGWLPPAGRCNLSAIFANLWRQVKPLMVSTAFYRTGFVVDRLLASLLVPGSVVILELAWRINLAIIRVLNQGITTPVLPTLAALSSQGHWRAFKIRYRERLHWIAGMSLGLVLGLVIVTLVALVMYQEHREGLGTLRPEDLSRLLTALLAGSGVLLCGSANHLLMSAFYAQGDTRTPTKIQMLSYMLGTGLKVGGFVLGGLYGIMAAMSIHYAVEGLALGVALDRRLSRRLRAEAQPSLELSPAGVPPRSP